MAIKYGIHTATCDVCGKEESSNSERPEGWELAGIGYFVAGQFKHFKGRYDVCRSCLAEGGYTQNWIERLRETFKSMWRML